MQWSGRSSQAPLWDGTCSPTVLLVPAGTIDGGTAETACSWTGAEELSRGYHHHCSSAGEGPFIPRPEGQRLRAQARYETRDQGHPRASLLITRDDSNDPLIDCIHVISPEGQQANQPHAL